MLCERPWILALPRHSLSKLMSSQSVSQLTPMRAKAVAFTDDSSACMHVLGSRMNKLR